MENQKEFLEAIKQVVLSFDEKAEVILYGSRVRGDYREDSDWDVLVLTDAVLGMEDENNMRDKIFELELKYTQPVSTIIVDRAQWEKLSKTGFFENVTNEGMVI